MRIGLHGRSQFNYKMKQKLVFALLMSLVTTGIVSLTVITANVGFSNEFLNIWLKSWGIAYIVAVPSILIIAPQVEKLVRYLWRSKS